MVGPYNYGILKPVLALLKLNLRRDMRRYWTADMHVGHSNIIEYADRPFRDCHHMNCRLIDGANERVKEDDTCVHVGDFMIRGGSSKFKMWRDRLDGYWVFLKGNHDSQNSVKTCGSSMFTRISHFNVFVSHVPYFYENWFEPELRAYVEKFCDFTICGHVHEKWKTHIGESTQGFAKKLCINVGVDQWNYKPVSDDEIASYYRKIKED